MRWWCNADGNAYSDCHSNAHTDANGYRDCHGDVHADAYSDANRGETVADAAAASNNTAAASVVRIGKWNSSGGNSRGDPREFSALSWIGFSRSAP